MKPIRHMTLSTALTAMLAITYTTAQAKNHVAKAYMFGFAASFNDSTVYFTNIQEVDSVWFTQKKNLLAGRSSYSSQLRSYFTDKLDQPHRTCIVVGSMNRKDVEKKLEKMKKMYVENKKASYDVRYIQDEDFRFKAVNMDDSEEEAVAKPEKKDKPKKDGRRPPRDGQMPPPPRK